jgi:hypothetical protein
MRDRIVLLGGCLGGSLSIVSQAWFNQRRRDA